MSKTWKDDRKVGKKPVIWKKQRRKDSEKYSESFENVKPKNTRSKELYDQV